MRVLGLLNFSALARRLRFDFSDVYKRGLVFDEIEGGFVLAEGRLKTQGPVVVQGPSSRFQLVAEVDLESYALAGDLVVTLPVGNNLPWPRPTRRCWPTYVGAGVLVAERFSFSRSDRSLLQRALPPRRTG